MLVVFIAGFILGGIAGITVMSIMHMAKYVEISDSEWDMWQEHLNKGKKDKEGDLYANNRGTDE
jgi:hypothetical protein